MRFILLAAALFGCAPAYADSQAFFASSSVTIGPSPDADAQVIFDNRSDNNITHNGNRAEIEANGIGALVIFTWDATDAGHDKIDVVPPAGFACEPLNCSLTQPEHTSGVLLLHRFSVGF